MTVTIIWPWLAGGALAAAVLGFLVARIRSQQLLQGLTTELALLQERLSSRDRDIERLDRDWAELQAEHDSTLAALQELLRENGALRARLDVFQQLEAEAAALRAERSALQSRLAEVDAELRQSQAHHDEKLRLLLDAREQLSHEFKSLATKVLDENSLKFAEQNRANLDNILQPLKTQLSDFRQKVEETYDKEAQQRFSLASEIKRLQSLNERISVDALNLTNALKGQSKVQGAWGEVILERLLERSGLVRGREYQVQSSHRDEQGQRLQPDVVIHLPENKHVVIDSKVSLTAFAAYSAAETTEAGDGHLRQHVQSVRNHIRGLGKKQYQDLHGLSSLDFVLLFIPVEGAFSAAIQTDADLFNEAFEQNIVLVSPSTLLATLRTIHNIWRYEYQSRNSQEIARQAGNLYDKFVAFVADLQEVGQRLGGAQQAWDRAYNKLTEGKGNLVRRVENLKVLGARTSKNLDDDLVGRAQEEVRDTAAGVTTISSPVSSSK